MNDQPKPSKPWRRWFQFSLRTLMLLTTVACAGLAWFGFQYQRAVQQREAVQALTKIQGVFVVYDRYGSFPQKKSLTNWLCNHVGVDFFANVAEVQFRSPATDDGLAILYRLPALQKVSINAPINDAGIFRLRGLTNLCHLELQDTLVTDDGLAVLATLVNLESFTVDTTDFAQPQKFSRITDAGMVHLGKLRQLKELKLSLPKVTDAGLSHLRGLTGLQSLDIHDAHITNLGLEHCGELTNLQTLFLGPDRLWRHLDVSDEGLAHIRSLSQLKRLDISNSFVTDQGLAHLRDLKQLQELGLAYTHITGPGLVHLQGLPDLRTVYLHGTKVIPDGMEHLSHLIQLKSLDLSNTKIADADLVYLQPLDQLEVLNLNSTNISDVGLFHLRGLKRLTKLDLGGNKVSDAGLIHLEGLTALEELLLVGNPVTDPGKNQLQAALPKVVIDPWRGGFGMSAGF